MNGRSRRRIGMIYATLEGRATTFTDFHNETFHRFPLELDSGLRLDPFTQRMFHLLHLRDEIGLLH